MATPGEAGNADFFVRPLTEADQQAFAEFVSRVPDGELRFLKEHLDEPKQAFETFFPLGRDRRLVAVDGGGNLVGLAGAFPEDGWSSHVAELRVLVSAEYRRHGVGKLLAQAALVQALEIGCTHAFVEVIAEQDGLVAMFQDLGFEPQALLPDFVRDGSGEFHDLMLLTLDVDAFAGERRALGLEEMAS